MDESNATPTVYHGANGVDNPVYSTGIENHDTKGIGVFIGGETVRIPNNLI